MNLMEVNPSELLAGIWVLGRWNVEVFCSSVHIHNRLCVV